MEELGLGSMLAGFDCGTGDEDVRSDDDGVTMEELGLLYEDDTFDELLGSAGTEVAKTDDPDEGDIVVDVLGLTEKVVDETNELELLTG